MTSFPRRTEKSKTELSSSQKGKNTLSRFSGFKVFLFIFVSAFFWSETSFAVVHSVENISEKVKGDRLSLSDVNSILGTIRGFFFDDSTGFVGVGTDEPSAKLEVAGDIKLSDRGKNIISYRMALGEGEKHASTILGNNVAPVDGGNTENIEVIQSDSIDSHWFMVDYARGFTFHSNPPADVGAQYSEVGGELMRITTEGNVGIGTSSPDYELEVEGQVASDALAIGAYEKFDAGQVSAVGETRRERPIATFVLHENQWSGTNGFFIEAHADYFDAGYVKYYFDVGYGTVGIEKVSSHGARRGNFGIRVEGDDGATLGTSTTTSTNCSGGDSGNNDGKQYCKNILYTVYAQAENYTRWNVSVESAGMNLFYGDATAANQLGISKDSSMTEITEDDMENNEASIFLGYNKVGIGTTDPDEMLEVSGSVKSNGTILTSDSRFKQNIKPISAALEKVSALRGVHFDWKKDQFPEKNFADGTQLGLIAQEVESVFPEVVSTDANGLKSVNYPALIAPLVQSIHTLKLQNEALQSELQEIKNELAGW